MSEFCHQCGAQAEPRLSPHTGLWDVRSDYKRGVRTAYCSDDCLARHDNNVPPRHPAICMCHDCKL